MDYGFLNKKWYVTIPGLKRKVGSVREEHEQRARDIYDQYGKPMICLSSGLDSQVMIHSFYTQKIPFDCAFFYSKYNQVEYEQLKILIEKYSLKPEIITIDPYEYKDEIIAEGKKYNLQLNQFFIKLFISKLPSEANIVQSIHDPYVHVDNKTGEWQFLTGLNSVEIIRDMVLKTLSRKGKNLWFGDSSELFYSILTDSTFVSGLHCHNYLKGNGLHKTVLNTSPEFLATLDKWDYYVKPLFYGKHWKDELIYFPKYTGFEHIDFLATKEAARVRTKEHAVLIPYKELISNLESGIDKTYFENFHKPED